MPVEWLNGKFQLLRLYTSVLWCCLLIISLVSVAPAAGLQTPPAFETPPILKAQDLAPATLLNGIGFHVDDAVPTDGAHRLLHHPQ